jgi:penicillin-binding protein 2
MIRQVQDTRGRVVQAATPARKNWLSVDQKAVETVQDGMADVVNGGGGTGQSAGLSYTTLCGKTGTAQWGPQSKNQRLAWFAGFLPRDNPRYAFAVLYEGRPGETVSGGRMAAPMVKRFFEGIKDEIKDTIAPPMKALIVVDEDTPKAEVVPEALPEDPDSINSPSGNPTGGLLKALPVEPLNTGRDAADEGSDEQAEAPLPEPRRAIRAIPVGEDEVIEEGVEEP